MKVLFVAAEAYPFAKAGGLGDVAGSLPKALAELDHEVHLVMPRYRWMDRWRVDLGPYNVPMGEGVEVAALKEGNLTRHIPVLMVDNLEYFHRERIYGYRDNWRRFAFFCRAVLEGCLHVGFTPDVIHCNDWHTALVPVYLRTRYNDGPLSRARVLLTIHNLAHQGAFRREVLPYLDLPKDAIRLLMHRRKVNFLKGGVLTADAVSSVSETYVREIQTREFGEGLEAILRRRRDHLYGVLNGVDPDVWDPRKDSHLVKTYSPTDSKGKRVNKRALQKELGLPPSREPLLAFIGRLVEQKGLGLLIRALPELLSRRLQLIILGTGRERYEDALRSWVGKSSSLSVNLRYDEPLAHRIYAGTDILLMPSKFEPCGLVQMIAMRYGTVPIVRRTGGLADTVVDLDDDRERATGFTFAEYEVDSMMEAVDRALVTFEDKAVWSRIRENGARQDFSWARAAREYLAIYKALLTPEAPPGGAAQHPQAGQS